MTETEHDAILIIVECLYFKLKRISTITLDHIFIMNVRSKLILVCATSELYRTLCFGTRTCEPYIQYRFLQLIMVLNYI